MKIIFLLVIGIAAAMGQKQNMTRALELKAIASLTEETQQVISQYASASAKGLLSNYSGQVGYAFWTCAKSEMNATLAGFPQHVIDEFNNVAFSSSTEFVTFHTVIKQNYTYVYELIGAAQANSTDVAIGVSYVAVVGTTIQQYKVTKECNKCWIVKTCCKDVKTPIGFTTQQQESMVDVLMEAGYQCLNEKLKQISTSQDIKSDFIFPVEEGEFQ